MKRLATLLSAATIALGAAFVGGCSHGTYVAAGTGPTVGYYDYSYYPDSQVYYYPTGSVYYWRDGGNWSHGRALPSHIHIDREPAVNIRLNTERPFERHEETVRLHPGRRH